MSRLILCCILATTYLCAESTFADLGGDHLIANTPGRSWRVLHRDYNIKGNLIAGYSFKLTHVGGTGETDDVISYELKIKENYVDDVGWDESKTRVYTGTGLIKSIGYGRVRFEIYLDPGNGEDVLTIQGYYHPGDGTSDYDDRIVMTIPQSIVPGNENDGDCGDGDGDGDGNGQVDGDGVPMSNGSDL